MADARKSRVKPGGQQAVGKKEPAGELIPSHPLSGREALLQVVLLLGIPLALLIVARYFLRQFFPSLGY